MTVSDYENKIIRFYFLLHRNSISESCKELHFILKTLKYDLQKGDITVYIYLRTLYEMIGHTRDIYFGRGERDLSYMMIFVWYSYFPVLAFYAFHTFVIPIKTGTHTYSSFGCWNDIKYFCKYVLNETDIHHPLIEYAVSLANWQLKRDTNISGTTIQEVSNVAKWIPRETKHPLLYEKFALNWFHTESDGRNENRNKVSAVSFMKKKYRIMVSNLCKRQMLSLVSPLQSTNHRACNRENKSQNEIIHGIGRNYLYDTIFMGEYVEMAVKMFESGDSSGREWLDQKWKYLKKALYYKCMFSAIPIVDMSIDISDKELFHSIGFACMIAELFSTNRILFVSTFPVWLDISDSKDFYEKIHKIWSVCKYRGESIFSHTIDLVFKTMDVIHFTNANSTASDMCFFIFSDNFRFDWNELSAKIRPGGNVRFVFWKIGGGGSINEFHTKDFTEFMYVSGNSPCLLRTCMQNIGDYQDYIYRYMNCSRYTCLTHYFDNFWDTMQQV